MLTIRRNQEWLPSVFNDIIGNNFFEHAAVSATSPAVNVIEKQQEYIVEVAAPGMTKDDFKVNIDEDDNLVVALEKETSANNDKSAEQMHYLRREFAYTNYQHRYELPDNVNREKIAATVHDGVLEVTLPKMSVESEEKNNRQIEIV